MAIQLVSGMKLVGFATNSILKVDTNGILTTAVDGVDYNTSTSQWTNTNGGIYYSDSVRVGTYQAGVLPGAKLHVFDYQTTTPKFLIEDGNTGDASMEFKISTQSYTMGIDNSDSDKFVLAASTALGTTNVLEVATTGKITVPQPTAQGAVRFEMGGYNRLRFNGGIDLLGYSSDHLWVIGNSTTNTINLSSDWDWDKQIAISYTPGTVGAAGGQMILGQTEKNNTNWTHGITSFYTNGSERLRINSSGNVGIGTTDPGRTLDVRGDAQILSTSSTGLRIVGGTTSEVYMIFGDADDNSMGGFGYNNNTNELSIDVNNSEAIRIDSAGNVGIGTTAPSSLLHLYKSSGTSSSSTGTTLLKLENYVGSDLSQQKTFIDFILRDGNTNETPQVRIGAEVGTNGDANTQEKEGSGAFVVYTNNAESDSGDAGASLAERFRVDYQGKAFFTNNVDVNAAVTAANLYTESSVINSSNALDLRSNVQHGQGDEDAVISFKQSTNELGKFDQDGYLYATGFKTSTASTGFLKADGSIDTSTYASSSHNHNSLYVAIAGGYYDSDFTWDGTHDFSNVIKVSGASATTTNTTALFYGAAGLVEKRALGTAAFSATGDFATAAQGALADSALQSLPAHNHNDLYYTKTETDTRYLDATARKKWYSISASGAQAKRYRIARVYYCPKHWDDTWQNIEFELLEEGYNASYVRYSLFGYYNGTNNQTLNLKLKDFRGLDSDTQRYNLVLGTHEDAGWQHSGQPVFYTDLYVDVSYYKGLKVSADTFGHSYQDADPTGGAGITVFYSNPDVVDITYSNVTKQNTYVGDSHMLWNSSNFSSTNISNWDTAYGWGNHASEGYLTSYTETDTLATVTARGQSTGRALVVTAVDSGNPAAAANSARLSGYGLLGNRGTFYLTNGGGVVQIGKGVSHNDDPVATFGNTVVHHHPTVMEGLLNVQSAIQVSDATFVDSARGSIRLNSSNVGAGNGIFFRDGFNYNASITVEDHNGNYPDGICISGYDGISFSTGSNDKNERMRITTAGRVGIGTTNPTTIFHAVGALNDGWAIFQRGTKQLYVNPNYSGTNVFCSVST